MWGGEGSAARMPFAEHLAEPGWAHRGVCCPLSCPRGRLELGVWKKGRCVCDCVPLGLAVRFSVGLLCPSSLLLSSTEALCPLPQQMPPSCPSPFQ